ESGVSDSGDCGDGRGRRREHYLPPGARRRGGQETSACGEDRRISGTICEPVHCGRARLYRRCDRAERNASASDSGIAHVGEQGGYYAAEEAREYTAIEDTGVPTRAVPIRRVTEPRR